MNMTLQYIQDNICYDLHTNGTIYHGNISYVTDHIADGPVGVVPKLVIANGQPVELLEFVEKYKEAQKADPDLTIEKFYNMQP